MFRRSRKGGGTLASILNLPESMRTTPSIARPVLAWKLLQTFGAGWAATRLRLAVQHRTGWLRRSMPASTWEQRPLSSVLREDVPNTPESYGAWRKAQSRKSFLAPMEELRGNRFAEAAKAEAERILSGEFTWFSRRRFQAGFPPEWHRDPFSGARHSADLHWSDIATTGQPDIKLVWELGRFGFAYPLARAYAGSGEERFAEGLWSLLENWMAKNPPNLGPHWMCGQEASFRVMALSFAAECTRDSKSSTPARTAALTQLMAVTGERIESHIAYALSQRNNHGLSEATGLFTIGLLFPELRNAKRWREKGQRLLEEQIPRLIYDDGSFIQHSINYHRLMLDVMSWAIHLGTVFQNPLGAGAKERVCKAANLLARCVDPETGLAPNLGHNDGALVLPLSSVEYRDLRPSLQLSHYVCERKLLPGKRGSHVEPVLWFFGRQAIESRADGAAKEVQKESWEACNGGYFMLQGKESRVLVRCARFEDRPAHADQLHLDLWWRGVNLAIDAGTFQYNGPAAWRNALASAMVHNTVTIDGEEPMTLAGTFLWLDWDQGRDVSFRQSPRGTIDCFEGSRSGYEHMGVSHRRAVVRCSERAFVVVDDVSAAGAARGHAARLHWLLADLPWAMETPASMRLDAPQGRVTVRWACNMETQVSLVRAGKAAHGDSSSEANIEVTRGWRSLYYADREPALSLALEAKGHAIRLVTVFDFGDIVNSIDMDGVTGNGIAVRLAAPGGSTIVQTASCREGVDADSL